MLKKQEVVKSRKQKESSKLKNVGNQIVNKKSGKSEEKKEIANSKKSKKEKIKESGKTKQKTRKLK